MRVLTVVGARPQFVKASAVSRCLAADHVEDVVHTGQHRDAELSQVFFDDLGIPPPAVRLEIGDAVGGERIDAMARGVHAEIRARSPDLVLVYGDTDSTLAGALAARRSGTPLAHVEAGLRSGVLCMPEEGNRIATDHLSDLLLCPTDDAATQVRAERVRGRVVTVGDVMLDVALRVSSQIGDEPPACALGLRSGEYLAATLHRASNVGDPERLARLADLLGGLDVPVVLACHPRTRAALEGIGRGEDRGSLRLVPPLRYAEMLGLIRNSRAVLTDSGGLQKEAYFVGVPCITLREETEWRGTLVDGWNRLVGASAPRLHAALAAIGDEREPPNLARFGSGRAADAIVRELVAAVA
jgi:UDP-N-acetylglucosamine 2-epimerase